ncbi:GNAT family N-acetyltransferase, partial [Candidatus Zixiibacteriota bacterium]
GYNCADLSREESVLEKVIVRKARPSDKEAVVGFCSQIWEGWDYLPRVWDIWLEDPYGAFLVAELDGRPVGTDKITVLSPGEVWLEGLRVDPLNRGKGLAHALNQKAMEIMSDLRPNTVRFSTVFDNQASRHMGGQDGFRFIFQCQRMLSEGLEGEVPPEAWGKTGDIDEMIGFLRGSSNFKRTGGLFAWGWTFKSLDRSFLERVVAERGALLSRRSGKISGLALFIRQRHGPKTALGFIDGREQDVMDLARQFQMATAGRGSPQLLTMVPDRTAPLLATAGFRQEEPVHVVVYELSGGDLKRALKR